MGFSLRQQEPLLSSSGWIFLQQSTQSGAKPISDKIMQSPFGEDCVSIVENYLLYKLVYLKFIFYSH